MKLHRLSAAMLAAGLIGIAQTAAADPIRIGIANFGEDPALNQAVDGFRRAFAEHGLVEGTDVVFTISHTNFDATLVPQMIARLAAEDPAVIYTLTTPVSQIAMQQLQGSDIPVVFGVVTDPVAAGLVPSWEQGGNGITGSSDRMDMDVVMDFVRAFLPAAEILGLPYNPGEANDVALLDIAEDAAGRAGLGFASVGVDAVNDIQQRITALSAEAEVIYLPTSNLLQPAVNAVAAAARQAGVAVVNSNDLPVREGIVPASIAVSYELVGFNAGEIALRIIDGTAPADIPPHRPAAADHLPVISERGLAAFGLDLPAAFADCGCLVD